MRIIKIGGDLFMKRIIELLLLRQRILVGYVLLCCKIIPSSNHSNIDKYCQASSNHACLRYSSHVMIYLAPFLTVFCSVIGYIVLFSKKREDVWFIFLISRSVIVSSRKTGIINWWYIKPGITVLHFL